MVRYLDQTYVSFFHPYREVHPITFAFSKLCCTVSFTDFSSRSQLENDFPSDKMLLPAMCATRMTRAKKVQAAHCRRATDSPASFLGEDIGREHLEGKRKHEEEEDQLCDFPVDHPLHGECLQTKTFS